MSDLAGFVWKCVSGGLGWIGFGAAAWAGPTVAGRNLVILVHGIHDSALSMAPMQRFLEREGWEVYAITLEPNRGEVALEVLAGQLRAFVEAKVAPGARCDLVGFSMGGVVARYYLQRLGGMARVDRFVALAPPNHGSWLAYLSRRPGVLQLRPGSAFLRDLNADAASLQALKLTTIWSPLDLMILPATSSRIGVGVEARTLVMAHPLMVLWPATLRRTAAALREEL